MPKKLKIFLAGGSGFIGRNIVEQLGEKYEILAPRHKELDLLDSEAVLDFFKKNPVDLVINSAAVGVSRKDQNDSGIAAKGLKIFFNLVRSKEHFGRMIMLGSGAEYDKRRSLVEASEDDFDSSVPADEYGFYKYACSKYAERVDFITHLRLFGVYGKYEDRETRFISSVIRSILEKKKITIRQNTKFDYLYIDDLVSILDRLIQKEPREKFINVGRGEAVELKTLAEKIVKIMGAKNEIEISAPGLGLEYTCSNELMRKELMDLSFTPFEEGVSRLVEYYKNELSPTKTITV